MWSNHWWCHLNIFFIEKIDIFLHGSHLRVILQCIEIVVVFRLKERRIQSCSGVVWCSVVFGLKEERRWSRHGAYVKVVQRFGGRKKMKLFWGHMVLHGAWFWERERWVWVIEKKWKDGCGLVVCKQDDFVMEFWQGNENEGRLVDGSMQCSRGC